MYPFSLPLSAPACCWVAFRLSKHRLSNRLLFPSNINQIPKQNYPSQLEKISRYPKENEPEVFLNTYPYTYPYQSSPQCDFCVLNHLVSRPATKGRASPPWKTFSPPEKMSGTCCMHNHCFRTCHRCKIWASLRTFFVPLLSQAGYGSAGDCFLVTSVSYAIQLSLFTIKFFRFNI